MRYKFQDIAAVVVDRSIDSALYRMGGWVSNPVKVVVEFELGKKE